VSQSLTIAFPESVTLEKALDALRTAGLKFSNHSDSIQLSMNAPSYVDISPFSNAAAATEDYATNDDLPEAFRHTVASLLLYRVSFNDFKLATATLRGLLANIGSDALSQSWVDSDYGWVIPGAEFLKKLHHNWDWRTPTPPL